MSTEPAPHGETFAVLTRPYCSEVQVTYDGVPFEPITVAYARTFAAALLAAADRVEQQADYHTLKAKQLAEPDASIVAAHAALGDAIRYLDKATTHGDELDRLWLAGIMRQLCSAREPLAEHCDITAADR